MASVTRSSLPLEKANYNHLVWDIAWYGLALAATTRFLQFYALKMGASAMDLGWLTALPALVVLFTTTLSPWWRSRYDDSVKAVIIPAFMQRLLFLMPAFAPFFPQEWRVPWIIFASSFPTIGQGAVAAIFAVMMRETIEDKDLSPLLTRRHMVMNIAMTAAAIAFGLMLEHVAFPLNYQIMFIVAFGFSLVSEYHVALLRVLKPEQSKRIQPKRSYRELFSDRNFQSVTLVVMSAFLAFHIVVSVIPLQLKNVLHASEGFLGLYGALEVVSGFSITLVLNQLVRRFGNRSIIAGALVANAGAALVVALAPNQTVALLGAVLTGASWSAIGVCSFGYFAERTAKNDMHAAMVYHQIVFAAIFIAPLIGSGLVNAGASVASVLLLGAATRLGAAWVCEWGLRMFGKKQVEPIYSNPILDGEITKR